MPENQKKKEQTAVISIVGNVLITAVKFIAFYFTSSIVVLAEAWHSLTDIITSFMVFYALKKDWKKKEEKTPEDSFLMNLLNSSYEIKSSILIGCFIFMVGFSLLMRTIFEELEIVKYPLESGLFFLLFAFLSYVIYKFETRSGKELKSPGLISDGMHSRSDALTSLFAGFSLILYYLGMDIERLSASVISIIIIGFGIEVVINSLRAVSKKEDIFDLKINQMLFIIFTRSFWIKVDSRFNLNLTSFFSRNKEKTKWSVIILILCIYSSTSFFTVKTNSNAIVERFGKSTETVYDAGLHIKLPFPIDRVRVLETRSVQKIDIGNVLNTNSFALLWTQEHGSDEPFISGDNNLFYPYLTIYYNIYDSRGFLYSASSPAEIFVDIAQSVITELFSKYSFFDIATYQRAAIPDTIAEIIQKQCDDLNLGIRILNITINDVHPPIPIATYFEDVIAAIQDKEMMINRSIAFRNQKIPEARSEAIREVENAKAYSFNRIRTSEGLSESFRLKLMGYRKYSDILRKFYIFAALSRAYLDKKLFIVDESLPMPDIWRSDIKATISAPELASESQDSTTGNFTEEERKFLDQ